MCDCIAKVNEQLKPRHIALKLQQTINLKTGAYGEALALETVSLKRGVKARPVNIHFCPFCGLPFEPENETPQHPEP